MKVDGPRSNHIIQTFHLDHLTEEEKKSDNYEGSDSNKNESFCSEDEIHENESQQEVSPRLKQKEIREKQRSYYDAEISAEVITKDIPGLILIPRTIYNHYKLFNEKMINYRKKGSERKSIITKDIGLKIEN